MVQFSTFSKKFIGNWFNSVKAVMVVAFMVFTTTNINAQCTTGSSSGNLTPTTTYQSVTVPSGGPSYYTFTATAGRTYDFSYCTADGGADSYDSYLTLANTTPASIVTGDDVCDGDNAKISWLATSSGTFRIYPSDFICDARPAASTLRYRYTCPATPAQPSVITGTANPVPGATGQVYSVTNVAYTTYNWSFPSGWVITGGAGTNSVTVTVGTVNGTISVTPVNACSVSGTARTLATTIPAYRAQFISSSTGSATWCAGESRAISVVVKNTGTATWTNSGPDINIGVKWNTWSDYHVRTDANSLAPGAQATYNFTLEAKDAVGGPVYGTNLTAGAKTIVFDVVAEGVCWFGGNAGGCGPGNTALTTASQTVNNCGCTNTSLFPGAAFTAPAPGAGAYTIATNQYQSEYNQMDGAVAGHTFTSTGSISGTYITVRTGSYNGTLVAQGASPLAWTATAGGTYYIHYNTGAVCGTANTSMTSTITNTTTNDNCVNATSIPSLPYTSPVINNAGMTDDYIGTGCGGPYKNVWWKVTGICGTMTAITCTGSTNFDDEIQVYSGSCGSFTEIACNDDNGAGCTSNYAGVSWTSTAGTVYYITVGSYSGSSSTGNLQLNVTGVASTSSTALSSVSGSAVCSGSNLTLTGVGGALGTGATWQVYDGGCPNGAAVASSSTSSNPTFTITTPSVGPHTYYIRAEGTCNTTTCANTGAITVKSLSTAPTGISGTTTICNGGSTTLTATGGTLGTGASAVWYNTATCGPYSQNWLTQPFGVSGTTVNNTTGAILNVTSTNGDPIIDMPAQGNFDPAIYRYFTMRYRVVSGTAANWEIFFYNGAHNYAVGGEEVLGNLTSDGTWYTSTLDMWSDPQYTTGGNILGWRFDWAGASGVNMEIDYLTLTAAPPLASGLVAPTTTTTYQVRYEGECNTTTCVNQTVTVDQFTTAAAGGDQNVCYTTATLAGNTPTTGGGTWTLQGGTGSITSSSAPNSGLTGLGVGGNTFRWTLLNGVCNDSYDEVIIARDNTIPTIGSCPSNIVVNTNAGTCTGTATWTTPTWTDNCISPPTISGATYLGTTAGNFYYFVPSTNISWTAAKADAISKGGRLATIETSAENTFVSAAMAGNLPAWLGYSDDVAQGGTEGNFVSITGVPLSYGNTTPNSYGAYSNWNGGEPNNVGTENYVNMNADGTWNDLPNAPAGIFGYVLEYGLFQTGGLLKNSTNYPLGVTTNTYNAYDFNGNVSATCSFTVTVTDNIAPTITCGATGTQNVNTGSGVCTYTHSGTSWNPSATSDNCSVSTVTAALTGATTATSLTTLAGQVFSKGTTTVTWTVKDGANLTVACSFTVVVTDNQAPVITTPGNQNLNTAAGLCTATYTIADPIADNCTGATWNYSTTGATTLSATGIADGTGSGSLTFNKGVTTVTLSGTDGTNAANTVVFTVTVTDNQAPVITTPGNQNLNTAPGLCTATYTIADPIADNCTGATWNYSTTGATTLSATGIADGTGSGSLTFNKGVTTVTLTGTDGTNAANTVVFTVTVTDNQAPVITTPGNQSLNTGVGVCSATYTIADPIADNCTSATWNYSTTGATTLSATGIADGTSSGSLAFNSGVTTVTLTGTDGTNAANTVVFTITVTDNVNPTITTCPANQTVLVSANCQATIPNYATLAATPSTDNCTSSGSLVFTQSPVAGSYAAYGTNVVTITVKDAANNQATCNTNFIYTAPTDLVGASSSNTCVYAGLGTGDKFMVDASTNEALISINEGAVNLGTVTASVTKHGSVPTIAGSQQCDAPLPSSGPVGGDEMYLPREFDVTTTASYPLNSPVTVSLYFTQAELTALSNATTAASAAYQNCWGTVASNGSNLMLTIHHSDGSYETRTQGGGLTLTPNAGPNNSYKATFQVNKFSGFQFHGNGGVNGANGLPVEFLYFVANDVNNAFIRLTWATALEINNDGFEVERSEDGTNWTTLGWVDGHDNSTVQRNYSYNDYTAVSNVRYYYRLKQIDNDGQFEYSTIDDAMITGGVSFTISEFIPNPTTAQTQLFINTTDEQEASIEVYDLLGQRVLEGKRGLIKGLNQIDFNFGTLAAGNYTASVTIGNNVYTKRLVITR